MIYVGEDQEDKQSILSNTQASPEFDKFVEELGWEATDPSCRSTHLFQVKIGRCHDGYPGGLPADSTAPYYATPDTELIFHVSTRLGGDVTYKWKHIGNDEVGQEKEGNRGISRSMWCGRSTPARIRERPSPPSSAMC